MRGIIRAKPQPWSFSPGLTAPDWQWYWQSAVFAPPLWEGGGQPREPLTHTRSTVEEGALTWATDPSGYALSLSGVDNRHDFVDSPGLNAPTTAVTLYTRWKWNGVSQSFSGLVVKRIDNADPFSTYAIVHWIGADTAELYGFITLASVDRLTAVGSVAIPTDRFVNIFLHWRSGGKIYLDIYEDNGAYIPGMSAVSASTQSGTLTYAAEAFRIGQSQGFANFGGLCSHTTVFKTKLTEAQRIQVSRNPSGPFRMDMSIFQIGRAPDVIAGVVLGTGLLDSKLLHSGVRLVS